MIDLSQLFDPYSLKARLYPALLMLLPAIFAGIAWFPALLSSGEILVSIAIGCGLLFWLADLARSRGKKVERALLTYWGGWPTTIWLRHNDNHLSASDKRRYHMFLGRQPQVGTLPTATEEAANPMLADERYASAINWLKEQCRGPSFPMVERENTAYGHRRNMLGLKPIGIGLCAFVLFTPALLAMHSELSIGSQYLQRLVNVYGALSVAQKGALTFAGLALLGWLFIVNRRWVREAADQYARALLACCDSLKI